MLGEKEDVGQLEDADHQTESDTVDSLKRWNHHHPCTSKYIMNKHSL